MENTNTLHDIRLHIVGNRLLRALETLPRPETYAEILRAARALIAVKKALDLLRSETDEALLLEAEAEAEAQAETETQTEPVADDAEPPAMNRQMRRMAEALARKQVKAGSYRRFASG